MDANEEHKTQQSQPQDQRLKEVKNDPANGAYNISGANNKTTMNTSNIFSSDEDNNSMGRYRKQQRLPSAKWRQQKMQQLEAQIEDLKWKNDQVITSNNPDDSELDWLRIVMDLDGHDVVADLNYVRRDSTEDPPTGVEPFSRPYHERRLSLAGAEEVF